MMLHLSFIILLYNEEGCLIKNLETIKAYLDSLGKDYEIILVNDGSNDNTDSFIKEIIQGNTQARSLNGLRNRGKGHEVKTGILSAPGNVSSALLLPTQTIRVLNDYLVGQDTDSRIVCSETKLLA